MNWLPLVGNLLSVYTCTWLVSIETKALQSQLERFMFNIDNAYANSLFDSSLMTWISRISFLNHTYSSSKGTFTSYKVILGSIAL